MRKVQTFCYTIYLALSPPFLYFAFPFIFLSLFTLDTYNTWAVFSLQKSSFLIGSAQSTYQKATIVSQIEKILCIVTVALL